jgi:cytochrome c oxidase subunit IV
MDPHTSSSSEVSFQHHVDDATFKSRVRKTTILLSIITVIELAIGLLLYFMSKGGEPNDFLVLLFKGIVCILTLAKAFYIVSVFMHLGDEIRNMIMTIVVPLLLFVWFITAFLWDGNSYRTKRNRYDEFKRQQTIQEPIKKGDTATQGFGG